MKIPTPKEIEDKRLSINTEEKRKLLTLCIAELNKAHTYNDKYINIWTENKTALDAVKHELEQVGYKCVISYPSYNCNEYSLLIRW